METAISFPDDTLRRVDISASALHMNRSEFFVTAAERYLAKLDATSLTWEIDEAVSRGDDPKDPKEIARVGLARLAQLTADDTW